MDRLRDSNSVVSKTIGYLFPKNCFEELLVKFNILHGNISTDQNSFEFGIFDLFSFRRMQSVGVESISGSRDHSRFRSRESASDSEDLSSPVGGGCVGDESTVGINRRHFHSRIQLCQSIPIQVIIPIRP